MALRVRRPAAGAAVRFTVGSCAAVLVIGVLAPASRGDTDAARARAAALVARMTLAEKISQVHGTGFTTGNGYTGFTPGIERLGIPPTYLADGPNGVGNGARGVTAFPAALNNAATWDAEALAEYGRTLGAEQAGKGNDVALAPTVNILRVPGWGRAFETLGEDPALSGSLGSAMVTGIQSQGVVASVKHYAANNQETGRDTVDVEVDERTLREIYTRQFEQIVTDAGVLSVMCAYNRVGGAYGCENPYLLDQVLKREWGFGGFVVSDWFATRTTVPAANAGLDQEMPGGQTPRPEAFGDALAAAVQAGQVPMSRLDDMVIRILTARILMGQLDRTGTGDRTAVVTGDAHRAVARRLAEDGAVLLKNSGVLPLTTPGGTLRHDRIAVIGAAAHEEPRITGGGSAAVVAERFTTPLAGLRARAGAGAEVSYEPGTSGVDPLPLIPASVLTSETGGPGVTARYYRTPDFSGPPVLSRVENTVAAFGPPAGPSPGLTGTWSATWTGTFTPPASGTHRFSLINGGTSRVYIDGRLVAQNYSQIGGGIGHAVVPLTAGRPVSLRVEYVANTGFGLPGSLAMGWEAPDPARVRRAVDAARAADVAVVVVSDVRTEGADTPSLALPGDQDALIEAVAAANPRTVVVLATGGPVLMPWVNRVGAVVETWYPGQEGGTALAGLLYGDADFSGRLPVTFPRSDRQGPLNDPARFPGTEDVVRYDERLRVGYRWYDATGQKPLFAFGHGLSYTRFGYGRLHLQPDSGGGLRASVRVTNAGRRTGDEVVQLYAGLPRRTGEPPRRLVAFRKVTLRPGQSTVVSLRVPARDLAVWDAGRDRWVTAPGLYTVSAGASSQDLRVTGRILLRGGSG